MTKMKVTMKIVFPQAIRYVIPSLISQLVVVVKDTTVAYVVSFPDLLQNARVLITNYDALVSVYFVVAIHLHPHQLRHQPPRGVAGAPLWHEHRLPHERESRLAKGGYVDTDANGAGNRRSQRARPSSSFATWRSTLATSTC
jgi:hypothetical protein